LSASLEEILKIVSIFRRNS